MLQRAVAMVLEAVYEQEFHDFSYGFRPRRSAHQACEAVWHTTMRLAGGWVLEVDIKKFFDTLDHEHLRQILSRRIRDGVILRLIGKWLSAGVIEGEELSHPEAGTPQGGVISPLLANIYLHEVLDEWFVREVQPRLRGPAVLVRYADGLTLHPDKTRLVAFHRPGRTDGGGGGPKTFDLLGFTHHWGLSWTGKWVVKKRTAKDRFSRTLRRISEWCRIHRHRDVEEQHRALARKLKGHYEYFGVTSNYEALKRLLHETMVGLPDRGRSRFTRL